MTMESGEEGRVFYASSNGDVWLLISSSEGNLVEHRPNVSSGGKATRRPMSAFLSEGFGPQHEALLQLLAARNAGNRDAEGKAH